MSADYRGLKTEIGGPAYQGQTDAQICAALNAAVGVVQGVIPAQQLLMWGASTGARLSIEQKVADPAVGAVCLAVRDLLSFGGSFDSANPSNQQLVSALVSAGVFTAAQASGLLALGQSPGPSTAASSFGFPNGVTPSDLAFARSLS